MYQDLGTQWASSIPAFLSLAFAPLPFVFLKVGPALRAHSKFANEAKAQLAKLQEVRQKVEKKFEERHAVVDGETSAGSTTQEHPEGVDAKA
jgi:hypothetical protein